ncbi:putative reverse transcriptase domain-containing protein [Tanacetum coccineum]
MYPPLQQFTPVYAAPIHHQHHHTLINTQQHPVSPPPFISTSMTQQSQAEFPQLDSGLVVPMFQHGEDLIECINKAMEFLSVVASRGIATTSKGNVAVGPPRVVKCYNCQGEGHMARQCTQPKRPRNAAWFKEKLMLAEAREAGQILDEEKLVFLANPDDLDAYDLDCDDLSSTKVVLMANLSSCDPEVLFEYSEQTHVDDFEDNGIHSGSNIILYSQYLQESQDAVIQDTNPLAPNDLLILSLVEQMTDHVDKENQTNKMTLILEEESRSKMLDKQNDPISIEKKIKISPIDYSKLNKIKEDFRKRFVSQKELSAEQAF